MQFICFGDILNINITRVKEEMNFCGFRFSHTNRNWLDKTNKKQMKKKEITASEFMDADLRHKINTHLSMY